MATPYVSQTERGIEAPRTRLFTQHTWWDILVDDLDVAQCFYGAVFDWTFPISGPDFVVVHDGTEQVRQFYASGEQISGRGIRMYSTPTIWTASSRRLRAPAAQS